LNFPRLWRISSFKFCDNSKFCASIIRSNLSTLSVLNE
jgi:hypothetical protein